MIVIKVSDERVENLQVAPENRPGISQRLFTTMKNPLSLSSSWATKAARNNAEWCDLVCRTHGVLGEFCQHSWINRHKTPPFYPNLATLEGSKSTEQCETIRELVEMDIPVEWTVKDSFGTLNLSSDGFRELLNGEWIRWPASSKMPEAYTSGVRWAKVVDRKELTQWERGWRGTAAESQPLFLPALIEDERIIIVGAFREDAVVAGCIGNRSEDVVGISNIFGPDQRAKEFRSGCVAAILGWSKGLPLVGYESGLDLVAMNSLGFETVGQLKVWVRSISSSQTVNPLR